MNFIFLMEYIHHILFRFNIVLNKENRYSVSLELSKKYNKQNTIMINEQEFKRRTYCEEFGSTVNANIQ